MKRFLSLNSIELDSESRAGFTLIEMLVAVTLVVLMMTLFAQIFQMAAEAVALQKGIGTNDHRAQFLTMILKKDLDNRTFFRMDPLSPTDTDRTSRDGYFYISENELLDETDDILQFTIQKDAEALPLSGKATLIDDPMWAGQELNQPEGDDGQITPGNSLVPNSRGSSRHAEVAYFLRNGNLYRRQLLIRNRYNTSTNIPREINDVSTVYGSISSLGSFWDDFDYSAHYNTGLAGLVLHDNAALGVTALSNPTLRFGHNFSSGDPVEYLLGVPTTASPLNYSFIGRFTHQETSDANFLFPGLLPGWDHDNNGGTGNVAMNVMSRNTILSGTGTEVSYLQLGPNGVVEYHSAWPSTYTEYTGARVGEDLLLSNVHSFDIQVWDDAIQTYVNLGHGGASGDFRLSNNLHVIAGINYGPRTVDAGNNIYNAIYDTWDDNFDYDGGGADNPPFDTPLKSIKFTIRFYDATSEQIRQLTYIHQFPTDP